MHNARSFSSLALLLALAGCGQTPDPAPASRPSSYAIYGEYARDNNKLMQRGLNQRVFNKVEAQSGADIALNSDGTISLQPGTYRITGFSLVTMQASFAPPQARNNTNYPGYSVVYPKGSTNLQEVMQRLIGIGSPQTALDGVPSLFDLVYTTPVKTDIVIGHQSGADLHNEVYLSVYEVDGIKSEGHVFARVAITRM